jgi:hypothetical protein
MNKNDNFVFSLKFDYLKFEEVLSYAIRAICNVKICLLCLFSAFVHWS